MTNPETVRFVGVETARASRDLRLAVLTSIPSLWSDAARGMAMAKELSCLAVVFDSRDPSISQWTGCPNAPVALYADELPRTGWAEILTLFERLGGAISLIPQRTQDRAEMFGLSHDICGEMGVGWIRRLLLLHSSFITEGREGFPLRLARYLASRYGYAPEWIEAARRRLVEILTQLGERLEQSGGPWFFGPKLTALDFYSAAALGSLVPLPDSVRPIIPLMRPVLERLEPDVRAAISPALLAHRDRVAPKYFALASATA